MAVISVELTDKFEDWRVKNNQLSTGVGDLADITGTVVENIDSLDADVGDLALLDTSDKSSLVAAINETKRGSLALAIALG